MTYYLRECRPGLTEDQVDKLVEGEIAHVKKLRNEYSEDEFLRIVAGVFALAKRQEMDILDCKRTVRDYEFMLGVFSSTSERLGDEDTRMKILASAEEMSMVAAEPLIKGLDLQKKAQARKGGKTKDISQGYLEKRIKIREIWASGKYTNRGLCAEQECAALDMAYDTARKALRNTPDPA